MGAKPGKARERTSGYGGAVLAAPWVFLGSLRILDWVGRAQTAMTVAPYLGVFSTPLAFVLELLGVAALLFYATRLEHYREAEETPLIIRPWSEPGKPKRHWFWIKLAIVSGGLSFIAAMCVFMWLHYSQERPMQVVTTQSMGAVSVPPPAVPSSASASHPIPGVNKARLPVVKQAKAVPTPAISVAVKDSLGSPVRGAQIVFVSPNGTHSTVETTNAKGVARVLKPGSALVDVYCSHSKFLAYHQSGYDTAKPLRIVLSTELGVGSAISVGVAVRLPGIDGTLDLRTYPDSYPNAGGHYLDAGNVSVNGHVEAVFPFKVGDKLALEDNAGHRVELIFVAAHSECFLLQYRKL